MPENELKSCPFCGGRATICVTPWDDYDRKPIDIAKYVVECNECLAQTDEYPTREEAKEAWNRREDI